MLQVKSEITGRLSDCTICTGVVMNDGERIGAIADIDLFDMFTIDMRAALENINTKEGTNYTLPKWGEEMMWTVKKPKKVAKNSVDAAKKIGDNSRAARIKAYAEQVKNGVEEIQYMEKV